MKTVIRDTFFVDVKYPINLLMPHRDLSFLPERMKINKSNKLVCNEHNVHNVMLFT